MRTRWLYIPVEIKVREFDSRLLLACHAAESGFGVLLGSQRAVIEALPFLPPGVLLDKSIAANKERLLEAVRGMGHQITSIDEEGFVYMDPAVWARQRASDANLSRSAAVFTWGPAQRRIFEDHYPAHLDRVISTGNPRIDLLRPEYRELLREPAQRILARHGRFILVPSNCALYINANGPGFITRQFAAMGHTPTEAAAQHLRDKIRFTARIFNALLAAIDELSRAFPDRRVVVRPHPGEDHALWKTLLHAYPNVVVEYEGTIDPWLAAAEVVVHNGCTSAIQAVLLDRPVVAYRPVSSDEFDQKLPNSVSRQACTPQELVAAVRGALDGGAGDAGPGPQVNGVLAQHLTALDGPLASHRIVEALDRVGVEPAPLRLRRIRHAVMNAPRRTARRALAAVSPRFRGLERYERQKFPGFTAAEAQEVIGRFARISGRFAAIGASPLASDLCVIRRNP